MLSIYIAETRFSEGGRPCPCCSGRRPCIPSSQLQGRLIRGTVHAAFVIVSVDITFCVHPFVLVLITCRTMKSLSVYLCLERMLVFGDSIVVVKLAQISFSP